jgi:hypothetical protein
MHVFGNDFDAWLKPGELRAIPEGGKYLLELREGSPNRKITPRASALYEFAVSNPTSKCKAIEVVAGTPPPRPRALRSGLRVASLRSAGSI